MGTVTGGSTCRKILQTTTTLLGTESGSGSGSSWRFSAQLEDRGTLSIFTLETNSTGTEANQSAEIEENDTNNTTMVEPILVSNDFENETHRIINSLENKCEMVISRVAIIDNYMNNQGLEKQITQCLNQNNRVYPTSLWNEWNQWFSWSNSNKKDLYQYNPNPGLAFLIANQQYSNTRFNTLRSAMVSTFSTIHEEERPIADQLFIKDFFSAKRKSNVKIPRHNNFSYGTSLSYYNLSKINHHQKKKLSLQRLQLKIMLLLSMATIH